MILPSHRCLLYNSQERIHTPWSPKYGHINNLTFPYADFDLHPYGFSTHTL